MAILTTFPSRNWRITFSADPVSIQAADITITLPTSPPTTVSVTSISGTGTSRNLVLGTEISILKPSYISITGLTVTIISTQNTALAAFLSSYVEQIRSLLNISLTKEDLPDDKIVSPFLRSAEFDIYKNLELANDAAYDAKVASDGDIFREKSRLALLYQTAALLVPSLPDIVEESILNERTRYAEFDPDQKIAYFLRLAKDEITDFVPPGTVTGAGVPIKTIRKCRVLF